VFGTYDVPVAKTRLKFATVEVVALEIVNPTNAKIDFQAWDVGPPERAWIPKTPILASTLFTYTKVHGVELNRGFSWKASAVGLVARISTDK